MRFTGNIEAKLDAKGRVFLPSAFRKVLELAQEDVLYLRKDDFEDCLTIFPGSVWDEQVDKLRASMNPFNRQDRSVFRTFVKNVEEVKLDGNGRFLIPKKLLEVADLIQSVNFIGVDNVIEIWSSEKQDAVGEDEDYPKSLQQMMSGGNANG